MRKYLTLIVAVCALVALSVAGIASAANKPVKVTAGNLEMTFNGGFTPKVLPKKTFAPIGLTVEGDIKTVDGTHPPALKEFVVETDKNGAINVKGFPVCKGSALQSRDTKAAEGACGDAIIGEGTTDIQVEFPEQRPIPVKSKLLLFNGGFSGGTTTLYVHAYITVPTPAAVVTTVKVKSVKNGRYGTKSVATVPKIAGGYGSVTHFDLDLPKSPKYKGKKYDILIAKCPDGKLQAHGTAVFKDGTKVSAEVIRPCTGKG
jgi:hypothetical protein